MGLSWPDDGSRFEVNFITKENLPRKALKDSQVAKETEEGTEALA